MTTEYLIKDLVTNVVDNRGKSPEHHDQKTDYPLIEINSIRGNRAFPIKNEFKKFVTKEVFDNWFRSGHPEQDDLLISTVGSIGEVALHKWQGCIAQNVVGLRFNENLCDQKFIYYLFSSKRYKNMLVNLDIGSVQPSIKIPHILNAKIVLPELNYQKIASNLLINLDKKIELNQKMNETLEEIAKTLFKSWFIDFDPVRAKAEGRPTGLSKEISDLFPDSLEDSELGEIPKVWQIIQLKDLAKESGMKIKKGEESLNRPYVPIDKITSEQLFLSQYRNGDEANSSLVSFSKGDILFGAMRPYFHKVCIAPFDGTTRTTCLVLNAIDEYYFSFLIFLLFNKSTIDYATVNSTGSTIPYIKWNNYLEKMQLRLPPKEIASKYQELISPILEKFQHHVFEIQNLSNLRDTLLPKLISGELTIPDAEKLVEEAGV